MCLTDRREKGNPSVGEKAAISVRIGGPYLGQIVKGNVPVQTPVRPGDTITVAERWF